MKYVIVSCADMCGYVNTEIYCVKNISDDKDIIESAKKLYRTQYRDCEYLDRGSFDIIDTEKEYYYNYKEITK